MNSAVQSGQGPSLRDVYRVPVVNGSTEQAPAYGVLQIANATTIAATTLYTVVKPTGVEGAKFVLNAPQALAVGQPGAASDAYPAPALISGSPAINQEIGPVAGSWGLSTSGKGFIYVGGLSGGVGYVASKGGTTAGDDFPLIRIANNTGLPLAYGSIVGYGTPLAPPPGTLYRIPSFLYAAPAAGKAFAVLLSDIPNSTTGDAAVVGVVSCQLNLTVATHGYADCTADNAKLTSGQTGSARILWREKQSIAGSGTLGVQWALVELGHAGPKLQFAEVYTTIAAMTTWGTPGTGSVKFKNDDGTDDGGPVNVANYYKHSFANGDTVLCDRGFSTPRVYADKGGAAATGGPTRFARAYTAITAATSNRVADWGSGSVKFMDDATGVLDIDPTAVRNPLIGTQFVLNAQVQLESVGGVWKVKNGTCGAVAWL